MRSKGLGLFILLLGGGTLSAQTSTLIEEAHYRALVEESSGSLGLTHFERLVRFSGFAPSLGAEQTADYLAARMKELGLSDVRVDRFPSDGKSFFWAFRTEPWWEAKKAELRLVEPEGSRLASFDVHRVHLARFSGSAEVRAELVDVGAGTSAEHYREADVAGKIVLATGPVGRVHELAVWRHGAAGVVIYRTADHVSRPDLVGSLQINPYLGPNGEPPGFAFSLSYRAGKSLSDRLARGERLVVDAEVETETRAGEYPLVHAIVAGSEPSRPEVWIYAHTNFRNTAGGNNLTGVGATVDAARTLATLIRRGELPRPRRNIHFLWGAEHMASTYYVHQNPDAPSRVLAMLDLDMVGDSQVLSESILRLYRTPHSRPSFMNDIIQDVFETVSRGNSISISNGGLLSLESSLLHPVLDPAGSEDPFYHRIEPFWGPSDHEDLGEASIGIPAVLLNTWPDPYIGTQEDTIERADATQMKRATVIAAASAYVMASAGASDVPALVENAMEKTRTRLAQEQRRASDLLLESSRETFDADYGEAVNVLERAHEREAEALATLDAFADDATSRAYLEERVEKVRASSSEALGDLSRVMKALAERRGWPAATRPAPAAEGAGRLVPTRTDEVRGPVNFFRPQYGHDWMVEKTGDPSFRDKVRLARRGHYYLYETLNFVDGKRNLADIRDLVAAEYGPAPIDEIEEYFRLLESVGVVAWR